MQVSDAHALKINVDCQFRIIPVHLEVDCSARLSRKAELKNIGVIGGVKVIGG